MKFLIIWTSCPCTHLVLSSFKCLHGVDISFYQPPMDSRLSSCLSLLTLVWPLPLKFRSLTINWCLNWLSLSLLALYNVQREKQVRYPRPNRYQLSNSKGALIHKGSCESKKNLIYKEAHQITESLDPKRIAWNQDSYQRRSALSHQESTFWPSKSYLSLTKSQPNYPCNSLTEVLLCYKLMVPRANQITHQINKSMRISWWSEMRRSVILDLYMFDLGLNFLKSWILVSWSTFWWSHWFLVKIWFWLTFC